MISVIFLINIKHNYFVMSAQNYITTLTQVYLKRRTKGDLECKLLFGVMCTVDVHTNYATCIRRICVKK